MFVVVLLNLSLREEVFFFNFIGQKMWDVGVFLMLRFCFPIDSWSIIKKASGQWAGQNKLDFQVHIGKLTDTKELGEEKEGVVAWENTNQPCRFSVEVEVGQSTWLYLGDWGDLVVPSHWVSKGGLRLTEMYVSGFHLWIQGNLD